MNVLFSLHLFPPHHYAGAEMTMIELIRGLTEAGDDVRVTLRWHGSGKPYKWDGVPVLPGANHMELAAHYRWSDIVVTHLDATPVAIAMAKATGRPLVHYVHNHHQLSGYDVPKTHLAVYNSHWLRELQDEWPGVGFTIHPPVSPPEDAHDYPELPDPDGAITLVNLTEEKGADLFWALARRFPRRSFIAVEGGYGHQIVPQPVPRNVRLIGNGKLPMDELYRQTRLVLMPSSYESFGRVAVEAGWYGIPSLVHPTEGLMEAMDWAGIYADRTDPEAWVRLIEELDGEEAYARASERAFARTRELWLEDSPGRFRTLLVCRVREEGPLIFTTTRDKRLRAQWRFLPREYRGEGEPREQDIVIGLEGDHEPEHARFYPVPAGTTTRDMIALRGHREPRKIRVEMLKTMAFGTAIYSRGSKPLVTEDVAKRLINTGRARRVVSSARER